MLDTGFINRLEQAGPVARNWRTGTLGVDFFAPGDMVYLTEQMVVCYLLRDTTKRHQNRNRLEVRAGAGWLLPPDMRIECGYETAGGRIGITLPEETLREVLPEGVQSPAISHQQLDDPVIQQMVMNIYEASLTDDAYSALYRDTMTLALAAHLFRAYGRLEDPAASSRDPRIKRVMDYIEDHLADPLSLDELAGVAAMSRYHFAKTFKDHTNMPPHRYVAERRIERAKRLLAGSNLPASEIAFQVGYGSQSNFSATFRRLTGVTPIGYRTALA
ncbi:AraC family transcriptional regulator [Aestuariispira insulae]|uniref:AraC family transcriptional regulator n=1 Tax=Aestuariispira insulae TaxID=1461337 RepID=A0A3D9HY10_9PROT|nr:AraC family transcriptional regulator [Aestuariispira insulae]RED54392.1 AraC family transcriptional regulator [Aestuariispira insulae]